MHFDGLPARFASLVARATAPHPWRIPDPASGCSRRSGLPAIVQVPLAPRRCELTSSFAALGVLRPEVLGPEVLIRRSEIVTTHASAIQ